MSDDFGGLRDLYQEVIFDHNRNPRNFAHMENATHKADGHNPLCGDQLRVYVLLKDDIVENVTFIGHGCAISKASASLMTEICKGKTKAEVETLFDDMHAMLTDKHPDKDLGKLEVLSGVKEFPARVKCATLAWHTLDNAIHQSDVVAKTE